MWFECLRYRVLPDYSQQKINTRLSLPSLLNLDLLVMHDGSSSGGSGYDGGSGSGGSGYDSGSGSSGSGSGGSGSGGGSSSVMHVKSTYANISFFSIY